MMVKGSSHIKDIKIINRYASNIRVPKNYEANIDGIEGRKSSTIAIVDFNAHEQVLDQCLMCSSYSKTISRMNK